MCPTPRTRVGRIRKNTIGAAANSNGFVGPPKKMRLPTTDTGFDLVELSSDCSCLEEQRYNDEKMSIRNLDNEVD